MSKVQEMKELTQDIGASLGNFFGETLGIENPFALIFGSDGLMSLDKGTLSTLEADKVKQVLDCLNAYFTAEKAGEDTESMLSPELADIAEKLLALKEVKGKIHRMFALSFCVKFA